MLDNLVIVSLIGINGVMVLIKKLHFYGTLILSTGIKVEGILRQSADVEEVERRVREYEQGMSSLLEFYNFYIIVLFIYLFHKLVILSNLLVMFRENGVLIG